MAELRRDLGLSEAVAVGVGGTVGGGIFVLVGVAAGLAGPAALLSFGLAFLAALAIALPYAELSCRMPRAGGGYAYVREVLGPWAGFLMGWGYWGAYILISGYVTLGFGGYFSSLSGLPPAAGAVGLVATITMLNLAGVKVSGRAQTLVVVVAIAGLAGFSFWGVGDADFTLLTPFAPDGGAGILAASLVAFLSFGGFDMVAAAGEEVKNPERNLPLASLITLGVVLILYLAVNFVALTTVPISVLATSPAPLAEAASEFGGDLARRLLVFVALLTTAATANAVLVVTSRIVFAMARDRLVPRPLSRIAASNGSPWAAVAVNGVLLGLVAGWGNITLATTGGGFLYVLHFVPPLIALVVLRKAGTENVPSFTTPTPHIVIPAAFVASAVLLFSAQALGWAVGIGWLAAGALYHVLRQGRDLT